MIPWNLCSALSFTALSLSPELSPPEEPRAPGLSCSASPGAGASILNQASPGTHTASSQGCWTPRVAPNAVLSLVTAVTSHTIFHSQRWDFCTGKSRFPHRAGAPRLGFRGKGLRAAPENCPCQSPNPWPACPMLELSHLSHARGEPPPQPKSFSKLQIRA